MRATKKEIMDMVMQSNNYSGLKDWLNAAEALENLIDCGYVEGDEETGYEITPNGMVGLVQEKIRFEDEEVSK